MDEKMKDILLREKERKLYISRVPNKTKALFIALANEEFTEDFGLCLKWCLDQALEYQSMKINFFENINYKLDYIIENISQKEQKEKKPEKSSITMMSGRKVDKGVKQNE